MKFLITGLILYFAYRTFLKPFLRLKDNNYYEPEDQINEGEYIDYEEVD